MSVDISKVFSEVNLDIFQTFQTHVSNNGQTVPGLEDEKYPLLSHLVSFTSHSGSVQNCRQLRG